MPSSGVQTCARSEEHTSELQSHDNLVCRLLLEKKKYNDSAMLRILQPSGADGHDWESVTGGRSVLTRRSHTGLSCCSTVFTSSFVFFFNDTATPEIYPLSLPDALPINDTATTEIYTLSLHDALPISVVAVS